MAKKPIPILHPPPKPDKPFALLAIGMYCNRELQNAKIGQIVEFWQDWRHDKRVLVRKCKVQIKSSVFTFLAQSIYGDRTRIVDMLAKWEAFAVNEGIGKDGFDRESCLLIEVRPVEDD